MNSWKISIIQLAKFRITKWFRCIFSRKSEEGNEISQLCDRFITGWYYEAESGKMMGRFWAMTDGPWDRLSPFLHFSPSPRSIPNRRLCYVFNKIKPQAD